MWGSCDFASLSQRRAIFRQQWEEECEDQWVFSMIENTGYTSQHSGQPLWLKFKTIICLRTVHENKMDSMVDSSSSILGCSEIIREEGNVQIKFLTLISKCCLAPLARLFRWSLVFYRWGWLLELEYNLLSNFYF